MSISWILAGHVVRASDRFVIYVLIGEVVADSDKLQQPLNRRRAAFDREAPATDLAALLDALQRLEPGRVHEGDCLKIQSCRSRVGREVVLEARSGVRVELTGKRHEPMGSAAETTELSRARRSATVNSRGPIGDHVDAAVSGEGGTTLR